MSSAASAEEPPPKRARRRRGSAGPPEDEFLSWLASHGVDLDAQPASYVRDGAHGGGGGLRARRAIAAGERVAWCPARLAISLGTALRSDAGKALEGRVADRYVMYAHLATERALGPRSFWGPWLAAVPSEYDDPLWWDDEDVDTLLAGTDVGRAVPARRQQLREALERVRSLGVDVEWDDWLWAHSCYCSRGFPARLAGEEGRSGGGGGPAACDTPGQERGGERERVGCLLPLLDMSNHDGSRRVTWVVDEGGGGLVCLRTEEAVACGTEAYNNYGLKPNAELLLGYGFAVPDNRADVVAVPIGLGGGNGPETALRRRLLRRAGIGLGEHHLERTLLSPALLRALRVCCATRAELYALPCRAGDLWWRSPPDAPPEPPGPPLDPSRLDFVGHRNELAALGTLRRLVLARMGALAYGDEGMAPLCPSEAVARSRRAHAADQARLAAAPAFRVRCGLLYRAGQRDVLHRTLELVDAALARAADAAAPAAPPPADDAPAGGGAYAEWLAGNGGRASPALRWPASGPARVAAEVPAGGELLRLPAGMLLTAESAAASPGFAPLLECVAGLAEDSVLALFLLHEAAAGPASAWAPFVGALPEADDPSGAEEAVVDLHSQLFPALSDARPDLFPAGAFALPRFAWAVAAVRARTVEVGGSAYMLPVPSPPAAAPASAVSAEFVLDAGTGAPALVVRHAGAAPLAAGSYVVAPVAEFGEEEEEEEDDDDDDEQDCRIAAASPGACGEKLITTADLVRAARAVSQHKLKPAHVQLLARLGLDRGHALGADGSVPAPLAAAALVLAAPATSASETLAALGDGPARVPSEPTPEALEVIRAAAAAACTT